MAATEQRSLALANKEVAYEVEGVQIKLTPGLIRTYLVRGKGNLVTDQEVIFFMGLCQARKLNPLAGDCYLVKYSEDPAAIITAIEFLRSRARASEDCQGWTKGIICKTKEGRIRDSHGLLLDDETLIGGWFEATPKGWEGKFRLEVNLRGYIKKTATGSITKFWQADNQPTMIAKVAEAQGLRTLWPRICGKLFVPGEIPAPDDLLDQGPLLDGMTGQEILNGGGGNQADLDRQEHLKWFDRKWFDRKILAKTEAGNVVIGLADYTRATADRQKLQVADIMADAGSSDENFARFWAGFQKWRDSKVKGVGQGAQEGRGEAQGPKVGQPSQDNDGPPLTKAQAVLRAKKGQGESMPGFDMEKQADFHLCPDLQEVPLTYCPPCPRGDAIAVDCPRATGEVKENGK
jgi:phage recombination protein Bet